MYFDYSTTYYKQCIYRPRTWLNGVAIDWEPCIYGVNSYDIVDCSTCPIKNSLTLPLPQRNWTEDENEDKYDDIDCAKECANKTSIASVCIADDGIVLVSDSRTSQNVGKATFSYADDYSKIVYVEELSLGIVLIGLNDFGYNSFVELVRSVVKELKESGDMYNSNRLQEAVNAKVDYCVKITGIPAEVIYVSYSNENQQSNVNIKYPLLQQFFFGRTQNENRNMLIRNKCELYNFGVPWGKAFLDNNQIDVYTFEKVVAQLTATYEELINIANKFQRYPVIGGREQSLIIKPDGTADTSKLNSEAII